MDLRERKSMRPMFGQKKHRIPLIYIVVVRNDIGIDALGN